MFSRASKARLKAVAIRKHLFQKVPSRPFCPKAVDRQFVAIGNERGWDVDPTNFLSGLASKGSALW